MKKKYLCVLFIVLSIYACTSDKSKLLVDATNNTKKNKVTTKSGDLEADCIKYIQAYQKWIDDYVRAVNVYSNDTTKLNSLNEYARLINVGRGLVMPESCQTEKAFQDSILKITNHAKILIKDKDNMASDGVLSF